MNRFLSLAIGAIALVWPALAQAAPGDATRLEYARSDRAASCPDQDALKGAVVKRLGYDPFFPAARQTIVVEITDEDGGLRAQMRLVDAQGIIRGSRELRDKPENCSELVASLALAISIALDPSAALGETPAADDVAPAGTSPTKEATESTAESPPKPPEKEPPNTRAQRDPAPKRSITTPQTTKSIPVALRAGAFGALGVAPAMAFGARVGASMRFDWLELIAEVSDQFPASKVVNGGYAEASLWAGTFAPCWAEHTFAACALVDMGSLRTEGRGVQTPLVQHSFYFAVGARAEVDPIIVGHLRLLANINLLKSLTPVTLRLYGEDVWKTPFASLTAGLGLNLRFP